MSEVTAKAFETRVEANLRLISLFAFICFVLSCGTVILAPTWAVTLADMAPVSAVMFVLSFSLLFGATVFIYSIFSNRRPVRNLQNIQRFIMALMAGILSPTFLPIPSIDLTIVEGQVTGFVTGTITFDESVLPRVVIPVGFVSLVVLVWLHILAVKTLPEEDR